MVITQKKHYQILMKWSNFVRKLLADISTESPETFRTWLYQNGWAAAYLTPVPYCFTCNCKLIYERDAESQTFWECPQCHNKIYLKFE